MESIIDKILQSRGDLTRDDVYRMIEEKKREAGGYLTDEGAARILAVDLGINLRDEMPPTEIAIKDLMLGLNDVNVSGKVVVVYPKRDFNRRDGSKGSYARMVIEDTTGQAPVVLWNEKADLIESEGIAEGDSVRVLHGYVREGLNGKPEVHIGRHGEIRLQPGNRAVTSEVFRRLRELHGNEWNLKVRGRVVHVGNIRTFNRPDGSTGRVSTLVIRDESGYASLNLWDDKAELSKGIKAGDIIIAEKVYTKERYGQVVLNLSKLVGLRVDSTSEFEELPFHEAEMKAIAEIKEEDFMVSVEGEITSIPEVREVQTSRGKTIKVASFDIQDDTGKIRVSVWRELAEKVGDLPLGTKIRIKNAHVKMGLGASIELTTREPTCIEILQNKIK